MFLRFIHIVHVSVLYSFYAWKYSTVGIQQPSNNVVLLFHWWGRKKKWISGQDHCLEFVCSCHVCMCFLWVFWFFLPYPKYVHVRLIGMSNYLSLSVCGCEYALQWKGILSRIGSHLGPWATGIGSSNSWSWMEISGLENNLLCFYLSFLNVYIVHIYFSV